MDVSEKVKAVRDQIRYWKYRKSRKWRYYLLRKPRIARAWIKLKSNLEGAILTLEISSTVLPTYLAYLGYIEYAIGIVLIGLYLEHRLRGWQQEILVENAAERGAKQASENLNSAMRSVNLKPSSKRFW